MQSHTSLQQRTAVGRRCTAWVNTEQISQEDERIQREIIPAAMAASTDAFAVARTRVLLKRRLVVPRWLRV